MMIGDDNMKPVCQIPRKFLEGMALKQQVALATALPRVEARS